MILFDFMQTLNFKQYEKLEDILWLSVYNLSLDHILNNEENRELLNSKLFYNFFILGIALSFCITTNH